MTSSVKAGLVLFVNNVSRATAFYRALFAMSPVHEDDRYAVLELGAFQLTVHGIPIDAASSAVDNAPVSVREDSYMKLCLPVASIAAARDMAHALGGSVLSADREWDALEFRACDGHDPEGNVIQLRQALP